MKKLFSLLIVALLVVACDKPNDKPNEANKASVTLAEGQASELLFEGMAETKSVMFTAKVNWMVRVDSAVEWFSVEPMYGEAGEATVAVKVERYEGKERLNGSFDIVAGDDSVTISVTQRSAFDPESEYVYIPDDNFLAYLVENHDADGDNRISREEAAIVKEIRCNDRGVASLVGIKNFTALEVLDCAHNVITNTLDLAGMTTLKEVYVDHNRYTTLNLDGCTNLVTLVANDNIEYTSDYRSIFYTKEVSIEGCSKLEYIELTDNAIEAIDLTGCPELHTLRMTWNNLTSIDLTQCPKLTHLYVRKNTALAGVLDLSQCPNLVEVWCGESQLTGVTFAAENPYLETLICYDSKIEALNLASCPNLKKLEAHSMALTELDVTGCPNLQHLWLKFNEVEELDLTQCSLLNEVQVGYNKIKKLDLSNSPYITILEAAYNSLTEIDLTGCSMLGTLNIAHNELTEIDLSGCSALFQASVAENKLTALDASNKPELTVLNFEKNLVAELNIDNCPMLTLFYAGDNKLRELDLRVAPMLQEVLLANNELEKLYVDGLEYMYQCEFQKNRLERLDLTGCTSISELYVQDNPLAYFSVYPCTSLKQLDMRRTAMKSIDLSNNFAAAFLFATENPQLETVFIAEGAEYSSLLVDEHVEVFYKKAGEYDDDVNNGNWGDEELDPWGAK